MTTAEVFARPVAVPVPAEPPAPVAAPAAVRFLGKESDYWRLRIKGAALVMATLGLYRFWLATDVRRFLWSNTEIAGDTLEYNGLATELLLGFLLGVAILVPLYMAFAVAALADTVTLLSVTLGVSLIAYLVEFARYRARRYRLTRTVFRGVRFDQHGRAWNYALRALLWWAPVMVTLGLAYPWAQASLQRFKLRHTCYGDLPGRFEGSGSALFLRGLPIWLLVVGPLVIAVAVLGALIDWDRLSDVMTKGDDDATAEFMGTLVGPGLDTALVALAISMASLALLYPLFQAVMLRWWISGLRFGEVTVTSRLRAGHVYRVYGRFALYLVVFVALAVGAGVGCLYLVRFLLRAAHDANLAELAASAITVLLYVVVGLGASTIYQVVVTAGLWRLGAQSAELSGAQALDNVRADGAASSALGEGLADALGVGGI
jgi:uncharacterized membrane protein YjgN (DUF898 family)